MGRRKRDVREWQRVQKRRRLQRLAKKAQPTVRYGRYTVHPGEREVRQIKRGAPPDKMTAWWNMYHAARHIEKKRKRK